MRMGLIASLGVMSSVLLLSSCSKVNDIFDNRSGDYKDSGSISVLDIPPDLTSPAYDETFTINRKAIRTQTATASNDGKTNHNARAVGVDGDMKNSSVSVLTSPKKPDMSIASQQVGKSVVSSGLSTGVKVRPVTNKTAPVIKKPVSIVKKNILAKSVKKKVEAKKFKARKTLLSKTPDGQPVLLVQADYRSTWIQTGAMLQRSGFSIDGKNLKQGLYAAKYKEGSLIKKGSKQIIHIIKTADGSAMRVLDENGKPLSAGKAKKILQKLKKEFSK